MSTEGADWSYSPPNLDTLKSAGRKFVVRYLSNSGKGITGAERADLHARGFTVCFVYETTAGAPLGGYAMGVQQAREAAAIAQTLGIPKGVVIYGAADFDATSGQLGVVKAYCQGLQAELAKYGYRAGIYGSYRVIEACVGVVIDFGWQTYAWSGGALSGKAHLYQYHNGWTGYSGNIDLCKALKPVYGGWTPTGAQSVVDKPKDDTKPKDKYMEFIYRNPKSGAFYLVGAGSCVHLLDVADVTKLNKAGIPRLTVSRGQAEQKNFPKALMAGQPYILRSPRGQCRLIGNGHAVPIVSGPDYKTLTSAGVKVKNVTDKSFQQAIKDGK